MQCGGGSAFTQVLLSDSWARAGFCLWRNQEGAGFPTTVDIVSTFRTKAGLSLQELCFLSQEHMYVFFFFYNHFEIYSFIHMLEYWTARKRNASLGESQNNYYAKWKKSDNRAWATWLGHYKIPENLNQPIITETWRLFSWGGEAETIVNAQEGLGLFLA